jgi:branched-chain amino acid transport system substrate-binding protein
MDDEAVKAYRTFFERYLAGSDITNTSYLTGYQQGMVLEQILRQCGDDFSRENIIKQAKSLRDFNLPTALPGVRINTSESNNMIWTQLQLQRWNGSRWEQFGDILDASSE